MEKAATHAIREETLGDKGIAEKKEERKEQLEANREVRLPGLMARPDGGVCWADRGGGHQLPTVAYTAAAAACNRACPASAVITSPARSYCAYRDSNCASARFPHGTGCSFTLTASAGARGGGAAAAQDGRPARPPPPAASAAPQRGGGAQAGAAVASQEPGSQCSVRQPAGGSQFRLGAPVTAH